MAASRPPVRDLEDIDPAVIDDALVGHPDVELAAAERAREILGAYPEAFEVDVE